jgi:hypothetical protein
MDLCLSSSLPFMECKFSVIFFSYVKVSDNRLIENTKVKE